MTPDLLAEAVAAAVRAAVADGDLALAPADIPADVVIERPRNPEHGDYATNIAMRLAKRAAGPCVRSRRRSRNTS